MLLARGGFEVTVGFLGWRAVTREQQAEVVLRVGEATVGGASPPCQRARAVARAGLIGARAKHIGSACVTVAGPGF